MSQREKEEYIQWHENTKKVELLQYISSSSGVIGMSVSYPSAAVQKGARMNTAPAGRS